MQAQWQAVDVCCNFTFAMTIDDFSFHDSTILEVRETTVDQTLDFIINFPTNWVENKFERRVLRFFDVIYYCINEIPFAEQPTILQIVNLGQIIKDFGSDTNPLKTVRNKIDMQTNSGSRLIEFSKCELLELTNY